MNEPDFQECESCACFLAKRTARLLTQHYERYLRPSGLRATQFTLLVALTRLRDAATFNRLVDLLGVERTTLTRNLQNLAEKGYIQLKVGSDRRTRLIDITPEGKAALQTALPFWRKAQSKVVEHLSPDMLKAFADTASLIR